MDSPARASAGAKGTNAGPVASRSRTVPIVARGNVDDDDDGDDDDDDEDDEDYVLGNLDASDLEDDSDEDEDEDGMMSPSRRRDPNARISRIVIAIR